MFTFALARELGMTHRELLERMPATEIAEWQAFYQLEHERALSDNLAARVKQDLDTRKPRRP